jgi:predicted DsbA family dithiol-disulfide isomerase
MQIEIWADIVCPWCGLGSHRLQHALDAFEHRDETEVAYRSFQLDPSFPEGTSIPVVDLLARKFGASPDQVASMTSRVERLAVEDGLQPYHVADNRIGNTGPAHELLAYATEQGRHREAWKTIFRAYFAQQRSIFDHDSLLDIATEMRLNRDDAAEALESRRFRDRVVEDQEQAHVFGARGVPFYVIDRAYAIAGAQSVEVIGQVLDRARAAASGAAAS